MNYQLMSDEHLLATAHAEMDPLTTTPLEAELIKRFDQLLEFKAEYTPFVKAMDALGTDVTDVVAIIEAIETECPLEAPEIKKRLVLGAKFKDLTNEAGDVFVQLNNLINEVAA